MMLLESLSFFREEPSVCLKIFNKTSLTTCVHILISSHIVKWVILNITRRWQRYNRFCSTWWVLKSNVRSLIDSFQIAQLAAALISITYTIDDGQDFKGTYLRDGNVKVTNLKCYLHNAWPDCPFQVIQDQLAHAYGDSTQGPDAKSSLQCGVYANLEDVIGSQENFPYYCRRNTAIQEFAYRFKEYNPNDAQQAYPHLTNRVITASSGICNEYSETGFQTSRVGDDDTDPPNAISALKITYTDGAHNGSIHIPTSALGREGTTYIYRGPPAPPDATTYGFGPRGLIMWVYRNPGQFEAPRLFECPITLGVVTNVQNSAHNIPDSTAREAAASIALQGQFRGTRPNQDFTQWQWYANGWVGSISIIMSACMWAPLTSWENISHPWEIHNQNQSRVGANVAEHAIVSLAQLVNRNPTMEIPGMVPYLGSKLSVRWKYFEVLLACMFAVDSLLIVLSYFFLETPSSEPEQIQLNGGWVNLEFKKRKMRYIYYRWFWDLHIFLYFSIYQLK